MTIDFARPGKSIQPITVETEAGPLAAGNICILNNGEGPRVLLVAGVHGDEYEAQLALHALVARLEADDVRGRLILIPEANFPASSNGTRTAPSDGANMNRTFPGNAAGTPTERLSAVLFDTVLPQADLLIDVHSGGPTYKGEAIAFAFHSPACKVAEADVARMMEAFGLPYVTYLDSIDTTYVGAAAKAGTAAIELEGAGTTLVEGHAVDTFVDALLRGLVEYGSLRGAAPAGGTVPRHLDVRPENMFEAEVEGLLEHRVRMGETVETGDLVAVIHPFGAFGTAPHRVEAKAGGIVISQRSLLRVVPGDCLGNTGTPR